MNTLSSLASASYGTAGIAQWIRDNVITLAILVVAAVVLFAARKGDIGKSITIIAGLLLGFTVLGLATGTTANDIGTWIIGLFRSS